MVKPKNAACRPSVWRRPVRVRGRGELGWGCFNAGDADARRLMEEGFSLQQSVGDPLLVNRARIGLLQVLVSLGELEIVEPMAREALALAERSGDPRSEHFAHHFLADCPLIRGDCAGALPRYRRALELAVELGDRSETAVEMQGVAMAMAGCGHPVRALRLGTTDGCDCRLDAAASLMRHRGAAAFTPGTEV